ncbi:MAG: OmpA family protein [candidate division Zixibacteria bacterium]|nr:OmpA family protein [candidate division Zixibacteria bacterium]
MKKYTTCLLTVFIAILLAIPASAAIDFTGVKGIGFGGGLWAPMMKGSDLTRQPFSMGANGGLNFKYGFSESFVLNVGAGYGMTYDDNSSADDATFGFFSKTDSHTKLTGIFTEVTAQYYFMPESGVRPYVLGGLGVNMWKSESSQSDPTFVETDVTDLVLKGGAGADFALGEQMSLQAGVKFNFLPAYISTPSDWTSDDKKSSMRAFQAYLEPGIMFNYYFGGGKDTDKDGVKDDFDQCPDTPLGAMVDANGCPLDEDGDNVYDGLDQCPNTPRGARVDVNGCPMDSDKDGVFDGIDKCANTPAGISVDKAGCPLDADKDKVPDYKDKCPSTPAGATVDTKGCPMDTDADGVYDGIDRCPNTPAGIEVDNYGCPTAKPIKGVEVLNIQYKRGSVEPDDAAKAFLDELTLRLKAYSDVTIEINGYTDALGSEKGNARISQKRADAVKNYLISKGVPADRMVAKGYGETNFLVPDKNAPENRRIEIKPAK